jgi:hypothetical protein
MIAVKGGAYLLLGTESYLYGWTGGQKRKSRRIGKVRMSQMNKERKNQWKKKLRLQSKNQ